MADKKISELTRLSEAAGGDLLPIVSDPAGTPVTKSITVSNLLRAALMAFTPGGGITAVNVQDAIAQLATGKANRASMPVAGRLASLNSTGDPIDSGIASAGVMRAAQFVYDFSVQGGAAGSAISLNATTGLVPANSVVWSGFIDVTTAVTSGSSPNASLSLESGNDILAPVGATGFFTLGRKAVIPVGSAASSVKTTAERGLNLILSGTAPTNNLTAGVFRVVLLYVVLA